MSNIIDKIQISGQSYDVKDSSAATVVELTQQEYDDLPSSAKTGNTLFVITDAQAGDLTQYWTSAQTQSAITEATSGKASQSDLETVSGQVANKQEQLVSGTNIKTINNQSLLGSGNIDIQGGGGGGKAVSGGTNISVTTGETADTINCTLPITANGNGLKLNYDGNTVSNNYAVACGFLTKAQDTGAFAEGSGTKAKGQNCHAEGYFTTAKGQASHAEGYGTITNNPSEHASGQYNNSVNGSSTFGDSGNTLFSVGNGTAENARHNAFEIRQNGDIYLSSGGTDIKLQDHLGGGGGGGVNIVQTTGTSTTDVMSQDAVTTQLNNKANKSAAFGGYQFGSTSDGDYIQYTNVSNANIGNSIYYPKINGKGILTNNNIYARNNYNFQLVETSAITTAITSSSTDAQVPSAKAVYDIVGDIETLLSQI